jgi:hypothetical protein
MRRASSGRTRCAQLAFAVWVLCAASALLTTPAPAAATEARGAAAVAKDLASVELCGVGPVTLPPRPAGAPPTFELLPAALGLHARADAFRGVLQTLDASADDRHRAAALMLRRSGLLDAEAAPHTLLTTRPDPTPYTQALARMARSTRDALVRRWALAACASGGPRPAADACQPLGPQDVLDLDRDDGWAWVLLAEQRDKAGDAAGRDDAMQAAARARRFPALDGALAAAVDAAFPAELPAYLRVDLAVVTIGIEAAVTVTEGWFLLHQCSAERTADPTRRALCGELAAALSERGGTPNTLGIAIAIGERSGWPADRLDRLRAEYRALTEALLAVIDDQPYTCTAVDRLRSLVSARAAGSERALLGRWRAERATAPDGGKR